MFTAIPFPWSLVVIAVAALGWLFGRWRGRRVSANALLIAAGGMLFAVPVARLAGVDGVPALILAPLAVGFAGAAAFEKWIPSALLTAAMTIVVLMLGEIIVVFVACSNGASECP